MKHYDEAELIESFYLPSEDGEAQSHLAACGECSRRNAAVREILQLHGAEASRHANAQSEFFWHRQQIGIQRKIARGRLLHRLAQLASIAAMLVVLVGGMFVVGRHRREIVPMAAVTATTATVSTEAPLPNDLLEDLQSDRDAWSADQLKPYHAAVEWESWLSKNESSSGGTL